MNFFHKNSYLLQRFFLSLALFLCLSEVKSQNPCPLGCECDTQKFKLKCFGVQWNKLSSWEISIIGESIHQIQILDLSKNIISSLKEEINLPSLKKLLLSENNIQNIHPAAFKKLSHLVNLDLTGNSLFNISREVFSPLVNLERLRLRLNKLKTLDSNVFVDLKNLRML